MINLNMIPSFSDIKMATFNIATINVRGLRGTQKRRQVFNYLKSSEYSVVCLQETHHKSSDQDKWEKEWEGKSAWCHAIGGGYAHAGVGILFRKYLNVEIIQIEEDYDGRILRVTVEIDSLRFQIVTIYGPNSTTVQEGEQFFDDINQFVEEDVPCIFLGDFNMVLDIAKDRCGGTPRAQHKYGHRNLRKFLRKHSLGDIWRETYPSKLRFTWEGENTDQQESDPIKSRIDRIYFPNGWYDYVTGTEITPFSFSDHDMVTVQCFLPTPIKRGSGYWKFNNNLLSDDHFVNHINDCFKTFERDIKNFNTTSWWDKLKLELKRIAITHSIRASKNQRGERKDLVEELEQHLAQAKPDKGITSALRDKIFNFDVEASKKVFVATRMKYLEEDEKPTAFFFKQQKHRLHQNAIKALHVEDESGNYRVIDDQAEIRAKTADFYETLYSKDDSLDKKLQEQFLSNIRKTLPDDTRNLLEKNLTKKEYRDAVFSCRDGTSPGWCGLTYEFWKFFWMRAENIFYKMQDLFLNHLGILSDTQRKSIITLLYKGGIAEDLKNWRPVSLLCTDYKIMSKVIATRLKNVLGIVINEDQTCSIPGRCIFSNLYLIRDLITYTNQKGMKGYIISIDQEKAFDTVDRQFLYDVFNKLNFGPNFLRWIKALYNHSESCVLVNGYMTRFFETTRGVRQGCSTSSEYYDVFQEPMVETIRQNEHINGIPLPGTKEEALASLYADDNTYFILNLLSLLHLFHTFSNFEAATGARVKPSKTKGLCLGGAKPLLENNIHIEWVNDTGLQSLGIIFFTDIERTSDKNWSILIPELEKFITRTKHRKLSLKGKITNLNMAGLAKFWYCASVLPFRQELRSQVEDLIFQDLWSTFYDNIHTSHKIQDGQITKKTNEPICRDTLFLPRERGGLAVLDPEVQSLALRSKFIGHIVDPKATAKWVFLARYWVGFPLGALHPDWSFLRANSLPKSDKPAYPPWYEDCLRLARTIPKFNELPMITSVHRNELIKLWEHKPRAPEHWQKSANYIHPDWTGVWSNLHYTYAAGYYQDIHYLFLHCALYTNQFCSKFTEPAVPAFCDFCVLKNGNNRVENNFHLFFECKPADHVWKKVLPLVKILTKSSNIQRTSILFNTFPPGWQNHVKKLVLSIFQIIVYRIWINRNHFKYKQGKVLSDPDLSKTVIFRNIIDMVKAKFNVFKRRGKLKEFRKLFCFEHKFCFVDAKQQIHFPFILDL